MPRHSSRLGDGPPQGVTSPVRHGGPTGPSGASRTTTGKVAGQRFPVSGQFKLSGVAMGCDPTSCRLRYGPWTTKPCSIAPKAATEVLHEGVSLHDSVAHIRLLPWVLDVELELDGVSSINNYSMRKVQRNTARNRQHMGVHRNTYRFCGKPIGCVAKNRCARKT